MLIVAFIDEWSGEKYLFGTTFMQVADIPELIKKSSRSEVLIAFIGLSVGIPVDNSTSFCSWTVAASSLPLSVLKWDPHRVCLQV